MYRLECFGFDKMDFSPLFMNNTGIIFVGLNSMVYNDKNVGMILSLKHMYFRSLVSKWL